MPAFRVGKPRTRVWFTSDHSHGSGTLPFEWDAEQWSEGEAMWDSAEPSEVVVQRTGLWLVNMAWRRLAPASTTATTITVAVNGADVFRDRGNGGTGAQAGTLSAVLELEALDVVQVFSEHTVTHVFTGGAANPCALSVVRIGPERWT